MAVLSILHRISGVLMVLLLPIMIYLFARSLESPEAYVQVVEILSNTWIKLIGIGLVWALIHHLFAGIRYLFLDMDIGITCTAARISAWLVHIATALVVLLYIGGLL